jgi:hypothetical protein
VAKLLELNQSDGKPALVNAGAITLVITPNEKLGFDPAVNSIVYVGGQQIGVTQTVAQVKSQLRGMAQLSRRKLRRGED